MAVPFQQTFSLLALKSKGLFCPESVPLVLCPSKQLHPVNWKAPPSHLPTAPSPLQQNGAWGLWSNHAPAGPAPTWVTLLLFQGCASYLCTCAGLLFRKAASFVCLENSCSSFPTHRRCHHFQERPPGQPVQRWSKHVFLAIRTVGTP